ncbi:hypothetical protein WJX74_006371 [Apatococcus lobatus]|uniref:Transmembrane protein 186 n=1 Tax=Apatococcus lobatus TaxID=904363 RepID=A0AAW1RHX4_9CHLO
MSTASKYQTLLQQRLPQQHYRRFDVPATWHLSPARRQSSAVSPRQNFVQYQGPLSQAVRRVKLLSVFSCASAFAAAPLILGLDSGLETLAAKASVASTLCCFGMFTTGLMHWFTGPYVHQLTYDRSTQRFSAKTMSLLARPVHTSFSAQDVRYPQSLRPNVTFQVGNQFFALDVDNFPDRSVLAKLLPPEPA